MKNSHVIVVSALIVLGIFFAGCMNTTTTVNTPVQTLSTIKPAGTTTIVTHQPTVQSTIVSTGSSSGVQIKVNYNGVWTGSYGDAGSTQSIDGTGSKIITLTNPNNIISCAFQKKDNSQDEMEIEILKDGTVLNSKSTTAAYGVVAVAAVLSNGGSSTNTASSNAVQVTVNYNGPWQGSYGDVGGMQSVDGIGLKTYTISNPNSIVSASFQKKDNSASQLTVNIIENGNTLKTGSTTAAYGVVLVSASI